MRVPVFVLILAVLGQTPLYAQGPALARTAAAVVTTDGVEPFPSAVRLLVGHSTLVNVASPIARVSLTSPDVADALVTSPNQLLINGKIPGTISMFIWDRGGAIQRYEVIVQRDLARLSEQMRQLFPAESIEVQSNGKSVVLAGTVSSKDVADKAINVAAGYVDKREEVVTLLQVAEGVATNQVLLRVRFAEVSRSALTELGLGLFTSPTGIKNTIGRVTTEQFAAPGYSGLTATKPNSNFGTSPTTADGQFSFSDFLNLFLYSEKYDFGAMIKALTTRGLFQSLAEPNLVAESGKEASFLAGGEFPIPIAQGSGANLAISVQFKEFGVRLSFTPTVTGDRIHLKVKPEVSTLDFNNAVVLQGFRIPALSTRRTETELELQNGQTFAIAGLLNNTMNKSLQRVPGIGDIPILGLLFRSEAAQKDQTELVVMITPEILPRNSRGVTPQLPRLYEPYLPTLPPEKLMESPPPAFQSPVRPAGVTGVVVPAPAVAPTAARSTPESLEPAKAAATVQALSPSLRRVTEAEVAPKKPDTAAAPTNAAADPALAADPATVSAPATDVSTSTVSRPLTSDEKKALERTRKQEQKAREVEAAQQAQQAEEDQHKAEELQKQQVKAAREQAKRDAEEAKRAAEAEKRQAEIDKKQQKAIEEATARLKAAETRYQTELERARQQ